MFSFLLERKNIIHNTFMIIISITIILLIIYFFFYQKSNNQNKKFEDNSDKIEINYNTIFSELSEIEKKQVNNGKRYTSQKGYKLLSLPKSLKNRLLDFWNDNESKKIDEQMNKQYIYSKNDSNSPVSFILELKNYDITLYNDLNTFVKSKIIEWTKNNNVKHTITYGAREYKNNSVLKMHVDQNNTHILSAIINIKKDKNWPLVVFSNDEKKEKKIIQLNDDNDLLLYESATVIHGRPIPFKGNSYVNIFVHFTEPQWNIM